MIVLALIQKNLYKTDYDLSLIKKVIQKTNTSAKWFKSHYIFDIFIEYQPRNIHVAFFAGRKKLHNHFILEMMCAVQISKKIYDIRLLNMRHKIVYTSFRGVNNFRSHVK